MTGASIAQFGGVSPIRATSLVRLAAACDAELLIYCVFSCFVENKPSNFAVIAFVGCCLGMKSDYQSLNAFHF